MDLITSLAKTSSGYSGSAHDEDLSADSRVRRRHARALNRHGLRIALTALRPDEGLADDGLPPAELRASGAGPGGRGAAGGPRASAPDPAVDHRGRVASTAGSPAAGPLARYVSPGCP